MSGLLRKSHFLGAKIRSLRKRNGLTLQDLSARCIQLDAAVAPSISYLSMIETGQRIPSAPLLKQLASVFQKDARWFLDENPEVELPPRALARGASHESPWSPASSSPGNASRQQFRSCWPRPERRAVSLPTC